MPEVTDQSRNALAVLSGTLQSVDDDTWAAARKRASFTHLGPKLAVLMCHLRILSNFPRGFFNAKYIAPDSSSKPATSSIEINTDTNNNTAARKNLRNLNDNIFKDLQACPEALVDLIPSTIPFEESKYSKGELVSMLTAFLMDQARSGTYGGDQLKALQSLVYCLAKLDMHICNLRRNYNLNGSAIYDFHHRLANRARLSFNSTIQVGKLAKCKFVFSCLQQYCWCTCFPLSVQAKIAAEIKKEQKTKAEEARKRKRDAANNSSPPTQKRTRPSQKQPRSIVCNRCHKPGHHANNCKAVLPP